MLVAEEVLRTRYGDDFKGCTVNPETVARIIRVAIDQRAAKDQALLDVYEKVVQGINQRHQNEKYLKGLKLSPEITAKTRAPAGLVTVCTQPGGRRA